jgi:phenylacetate-CoA ligase
MPNSVLEALACGLPVVSTRVGGVPYLVRDGVSALLVDAGDAEAMAGAILRLLRDAGLAERLVTAGVADAQQYTWARVRLRLAELYGRVLPVGQPRVTTA